MTWLADLSPCWYLDHDRSLGLVAVGWLSNANPFTQGDISPEFRRALARQIYACQQLIEHYIDAHHYRPPDALCEAVRECPDVGSEEYFLRILRLGGRAWASGIAFQSTLDLAPLDDDPRIYPALRDRALQARASARNALRAIDRWRAERRIRWLPCATGTPDRS